MIWLVARALDVDLARLETEHYTTMTGLADLAAELYERACAAGLVSEAERAVLMAAHVDARAGDVGAGLPVYRKVLERAERRGDWVVAARAHALTGFDLDHLGLQGQALEHVLQAVELLPDVAPLHLRAEHRMLLAFITSQDATGQVFDEHFTAALELARECHQPHLVLSVLNNYAWSLYGAGRLDDAAHWLGILRQDAERFAIPMSAAALDTAANVFMARRELDQAERAIHESLEPWLSQDDVTARPQALVTLSRLRQEQGDLASAASTAVEAAHLSSAHNLKYLQALATHQIAELAALAGDFRKAYESMREWEDLWAQVRSRENDARATAIQVVLATQDAHRRGDRFELMAETDPLTGLRNRRYVDRELSRMLLGLNGAAPLALALIDIDRFKLINDAGSHQLGDEILVAVSQLVQRELASAPPGSFAARLGGDEFVVVLPSASADAAASWAQGLRQAVRDSDWDALGWTKPVTLSIGVGITSLAVTPSSLLRIADTSLYEAKRAGRDQVRVAAHTSRS